MSKQKKIKVYRVPQYLSKRVNVICVDGIPVCTARGKKITDRIVASLSGYEVDDINDGRISKLAELGYITVDEKKPCYVCGRLTNRIEYNYEAYICSKKCEDKINEKLIAVGNDIHEANRPLMHEYKQFCKTKRGKEWKRFWQNETGSERSGDFHDYLYDFHPEILQQGGKK